MKNKNLIIGLVVAVAVIGIILIAKPFVSKKPAKKAAPLAKVTKGAVQVPVKKPISKDKGGLTVRIVDYKKKEMALGIKAFRSIDARSSIYATSLVANRMYELSPGTYDLEIGTIPQRIYKNVRVVNGRENIENLGSITGSINVKALNAKKTNAYYPVGIFYSKSNDAAATTTTNRPLEIIPGIYDIEIGTMPKQIKKDVKVEAGKEVALDLGCTTGTLLVKAVDENKKEARYGVRIIKSENNELVVSSTTNRPMEILQGVYRIEILSTPKQESKEVKVSAGEETSIEFLVQAPPAPPARVPPKAVKK